MDDKKMTKNGCLCNTPSNLMMLRPASSPSSAPVSGCSARGVPVSRQATFQSGDTRCTFHGVPASSASTALCCRSSVSAGRSAA